MQQSTHQQQVTVSSLLGLMALAIAAGRNKAPATGDDAGRGVCDRPSRPAAACCPRPEAAAV